MAIRKGGRAVSIDAVVIPGPNLLTLRKPDTQCLDSTTSSLDKLDSFPRETQSGQLSKMAISFSLRSISLSFICQSAQSLGKFTGDFSSNSEDITVTITVPSISQHLSRRYRKPFVKDRPSVHTAVGRNHHGFTRKGPTRRCQANGFKC